MPCSKKDQAQNEGYGQKSVEHHPPHIEKEVANVGITAEGADDRGQCAKTDRGRKKEHR